MKWKVSTIAAAMMGAGLLASGPSATAQDSIDNTNCGLLAFEGLGHETCTQPNPLPGEGLLFTAAEQVVSIISAIADDFGCPAVAFAGPIPVTITDNQVFPQRTTARIGGAVNFATFNATEQSNTQHFAGPFLSNGVRVHLTALTAAGNFLSSTLPGTGLAALTGQYNSDGPYGVLYGTADFVFNGDGLDERIIKDFYQGVAVAAELLPGQSALDARIIRDNGLEVTTKKHVVGTLPAGTLLQSHPKGKWRQTSFYRGPDGGDGSLVYTKVRIAPFGKPECALQLNGRVVNSISFPRFVGAVTVFPLATCDEASPTPSCT